MGGHGNRMEKVMEGEGTGKDDWNEGTIGGNVKSRAVTTYLGL